MGSRYVLEMEVALGSANSRLEQLESKLGRVANAIEKINAAPQNDNGSLDKLEGYARSDFLERWSDKLQDVGNDISGIGEDLVAAGKGLFMGITQEAKTFEDTQSALQFAFGSKWERVFQQVKDEAANLTFTFDQVAGLAASMGRMKINPFGTTGDDLKVFKSKTGEAVSALQVLQDVSDATGRNTEALMFSLRNAMAGQFRSLKDAVDMPTEAFNKLTKSMNAVKDPQEKYNVLIKQLGEYFGGAGLAKAQNYSKAIMQIPDLIQQLKAGVGAEGLKVLSKAVFEFVAALSSLVKNKEAVSALGKAFTLVASGVAAVIRVGARVVNVIEQILEKAPYLPIIAAAFLGAVVVGTILIGTLFGISAALTAVIAAVMTLEVALLPIFILSFVATLGILIGAFVLLAGVVTLAYTAYKVFTSGNDGMVNSLEKAKLVFGALVELIGSYSDGIGTMSMETANSLKDAGLLGFTVELFQKFQSLVEWVDEFSATVDELGTTAGPAFRGLVSDVVTLLREIVGGIEATSSATDDLGLSGADAGVLFTQFALASVDAARDIVSALRKTGLYVDLLGYKYEKLAATAQTYVNLMTLGAVGDGLGESLSRYKDAAENELQTLEALNKIKESDTEREKERKARVIPGAMSTDPGDSEEGLYSTGPEGDAAEAKRQRREAAKNGRSYEDAYAEKQTMDYAGSGGTSGTNYPTSQEPPTSLMLAANNPDPQVAVLLAAQNAELSSQTVLLSAIADKISSQKTDAE